MTSTSMSLLAQIRAKRLLGNKCAEYSVRENPVVLDVDAEAQKAMDEFITEARVMKRGVSSLSVKHQRRIGLPVVKSEMEQADRREGRITKKNSYFGRGV